MADEWFCEIAGREIGPLSPQQLQTMAAKGQILPRDCVRQGAQGVWIPAQQVKGLFPQAPTSSTPSVPLAPAAIPAVAQRASEPPAVAQPPLPPPAPPLRMSTPLPVVGPSTRLLLNQKRRLRRQKTMVAWLVVGVMGLAILALVLIIRSQLGSEPAAGNAQAASTNNANGSPHKIEKAPKKVDVLDDLESLDPAQPKKRVPAEEDAFE
jgi:hypothetical protein